MQTQEPSFPSWGTGAEFPKMHMGQEISKKRGQQIVRVTGSAFHQVSRWDLFSHILWGLNTPPLPSVSSLSPGLSVSKAHLHPLPLFQITEPLRPPRPSWLSVQAICMMQPFPGQTLVKKTHKHHKRNNNSSLGCSLGARFPVLSAKPKWPLHCLTRC